MNNYSTATRSRFTQALIIGAIAGAAISLFDRGTRRSVMNSSKRYVTDVRTMVTHPNSALDQVTEATAKLRTTIENISEDIAFITARVEEMKDIPPQVAQMVKETKDAFVSDNGVHHVNHGIYPANQSSYVVSQNVQH
ncbi:YtxH domain-containing protein [Bacillus sp. CECT 9360]|uniref:YtxH domain-containing protein n=1 Tax=Bacillus sp. CECT 9360 TaxID=2845821 RepID=UPI001E32D39B|nr:YtxH domain-containing protein [Bacillus sp. CECT 9360]CAH0345197.1 hypothetical protein BCI9360_01476 [Bacillus sp. CECT 9360]